MRKEHISFKKTLFYKVFGFPLTLGDLTEKAKRENESKLHVLVKCTPLRAYPQGPCQTEVTFDVSYYHGRDNHTVNVRKVYLNHTHYNPNPWIREICSYIEKQGLKVQTVRKRGFVKKEK
jgi:hypothetical protein